MHLIHVRITLAYKHAVHTKTHVIRRPLFCVIMQQMYVSKSSLLLITYYIYYKLSSETLVGIVSFLIHEKITKVIVN